MCVVEVRKTNCRRRGIKGPVKNESCTPCKNHVRTVCAVRTSKELSSTAYCVQYTASIGESKTLSNTQCCRIAPTILTYPSVPTCSKNIVRNDVIIVLTAVTWYVWSFISDVRSLIAV